MPGGNGAKKSVQEIARELGKDLEDVMSAVEQLRCFYTGNRDDLAGRILRETKADLRNEAEIAVVLRKFREEQESDMRCVTTNPGLIGPFLDIASVLRRFPSGRFLHQVAVNIDEPCDSHGRSDYSRLVEELKGKTSRITWSNSMSGYVLTNEIRMPLAAELRWRDVEEGHIYSKIFRELCKAAVNVYREEIEYAWSAIILSRLLLEYLFHRTWLEKASRGQPPDEELSPAARKVIIKDVISILNSGSMTQAISDHGGAVRDGFMRQLEDDEEMQCLLGERFVQELEDFIEHF